MWLRRLIREWIQRALLEAIRGVKTDVADTTAEVTACYTAANSLVLTVAKDVDGLREQVAHLQGHLTAALPPLVEMTSYLHAQAVEAARRDAEESKLIGKTWLVGPGEQRVAEEALRKESEQRRLLRPQRG